MRKILLTSTGFNNKRFAELFLAQNSKEPKEIKVIFVPTAAVFDDAREMLPECMRDLTDAGIAPENIFVYHLGYVMSHTHSRAYRAGQSDINPAFRLLSGEEIGEYDAIYFCGGSTKHLLAEIERTGFYDVLKQAVENGLFYIGVSAGSIICAANLPGNLAYLDLKLNVHCKEGSPCRKIEDNPICLTDSQAVWICGDSIEVVE